MTKTLFLYVFLPAIALSQQQKRSIGLEIESGEPIPVAVDEMSNAAAHLGLTVRAIRDRIGNHLKKIGVETSKVNKGFYLSVDVEVDDKAFGVILKFRRIGSFTARKQKYQQYITSWVVYSFGFQNGQANPIWDSIDENVGYFIQGFKMANPNY